MMINNRHAGRRPARVSGGRRKKVLKVVPGDRREEAFRLYRDMGLARTYPKLQEALRPKFGPITVRTFSAWARANDWRQRLEAHDAIQPPPHNKDDDEAEFDQVDALTRLAKRLMRRALEAAPAVSKTSDVKSLIDSAMAAINLADKIRLQQQERVPDDVARKEMFEILNRFEGRIRQLHRRIRVIRLMAEAAGVEIDMDEVERRADAEIPGEFGAGEDDAVPED